MHQGLPIRSTLVAQPLSKGLGMGWREGRGLQLGILRIVLSYTEEEKAEARAFEEDQVAGRLKEDVVSMVGGCGCG